MSYWEKRQEEAYKAGEMQVNQYFMRLEKAFNQAKRELQKTVESFYWLICEGEWADVFRSPETAR